MSIYRGTMNWEGYADNEEFTVILPFGSSRLDDPIHLYWQWSQNSNGDTKVNVLSKTTITSVTRIFIELLHVRCHIKTRHFIGDDS